MLTDYDYYSYLLTQLTTEKTLREHYIMSIDIIAIKEERRESIIKSSLSQVSY